MSPQRAFAALVFVMLAGGCFLGCSPMVYTHGVPNLDTVDTDLYRVGCPTKEGWDYLVNELHVRSYVKLAFDDECSAGYAEARGVRVFRIQFEPGHAIGLAGGPTQDQLHQVAALLADTSLRPMAYGCLHGQDRTGIVTTAHRLDEGWSRDEAFREAIAHHYHAWLLGLDRAWKAYRP